LICLSFYSNLSAQLFRNKNSGFNIGVVFALGNKFQRIGYTFQTYYFYKFVQLNGEVRLYYNLKNLGPKKEYGEIVTSAGIVIGYGKKQNWYNPFLSPVSNQTKYSNSIGYAYNAYFNKIKTKQQTGTLALQFNGISIIADNDLLAKPVLDRFRTGALLLQYQYKNYFQTGLNCTMWTGQMGQAVKDDKDFPAIGYMDTTGGLYTNYSHGLLSLQFKGNIGLGQNVQGNLGVDAQQVRNVVQNRFSHDLAFLPKKWFKRINCHIPMLDTLDNQYLYKPGQKIKKPDLYWNVFSGSSLFY
jgi:hypothetical protein